MKPGGTMSHTQGLSNKSLSLAESKPIPRIDTYFFKIYSNIILLSTLGPPKDIFPVLISIKF